MISNPSKIVLILLATRPPDLLKKIGGLVFLIRTGFLIPEVRNPAPTLAQLVGGGFRFASPGKNAFFVSLHADDSLAGFEVGEVPYLFADELRVLVENLVVNAVVFHLILFREHDRIDVVESRDRVGAVFGKHDRFAGAALFPLVEFFAQLEADLVPFPAIGVPPVITVERQHVDQLGDPVRIGIGSAVSYDRDGTLLRIEFAGQLDQRLEIFERAFFFRGRFVGDRPHHDAGVVFIAGDQFFDHLLVRVERIRFFPRIAARHAEHRGCEIQVKADRGRLVDHHDAFPVCQPHHFFGVRIMGGPERIGADPLQQVEIEHVRRFVEAAPMDVRVFVFAESFEVKRFAVDQKLAVFHFDGTDAERLLVHVYHAVFFQQFDSHRVQISVQRFP